jgi:hypothetical protein
MEIPFDKIKVNYAVVVFFMIVTCLLFPIVLLLLANYKTFFEFDTIKILIVLLSVGCTEFAIIYLSFVITMMHTNFSEAVLDDTVINFLIRDPLVSTSCFLVLIYTIQIICSYNLRLGINQNIHFLIIIDIGTIIGTVGDVIFAAADRRRKRKSERK